VYLPISEHIDVVNGEKLITYLSSFLIPIGASRSFDKARRGFQFLTSDL